MRSFSTHSSLPTLLLFSTTLAPTIAQSNSNPILTSSFTWNPTCGPTVACGPSAAGYYGTGFAASNNLTFAGCTNIGGDSVDCSAASIVSGVGKGCGQCWHITPQSDWYPSNGLSVGTSVVVKINDQCTDAGYCDQTEAHPVNTGYGKEVHIDLCAESGVTGQFFGAVGPGVVVGLAQLLPDCSALDNGPYGSGLGSLDGSSSAASSSSSSSGSASSNSGSASSSSSGSESSSSSASDSSSSSGSDSSSSSGSGSSSSSGSDSSSSSGSDSSSSSGSGSSSSSGSGSSSSSGSDSSSSSGSDSSSSSGSGSSSSSGSGSSSSSDSSSSNSGSDSSSSSGSSSSSNSASDSSSDPGPELPNLDTVTSGSGNWSWSGTKMAKHKLSSGHDGPKAGTDVVIGAPNGGSNAGSNDRGVSSSSSAPPPTPTTLVSMISSSTAPAAVGPSSSTGVGTPEQDGDDEDGDECDGGDVSES